MSLIKTLKSLFSGAQEAPKQPDITPEEPEQEPDQPAVDPQRLAEARRSEEELLDRLSEFQILSSESMSRSFLVMQVYRFNRSFDGPDMRTLINGMRWLGFRIYSFSVRIAGEDHECESWQQFSRHLAESPLEAVSMVTSFGGVRVNCVIEAEGSVHFSHDSSRGVDFSPFEGLFDPEEIDPEDTNPEEA